ncbi:hypothetical protein, partial [Siphonobacter sp. SORGH_AS_0500]|uniref:hypothetical protein n=1 Tax=Siphonobacter sp. SORGH_AS_0500 TaxID=1864824 RepID=UPI001E41DA8F
RSTRLEPSDCGVGYQQLNVRRMMPAKKLASVGLKSMDLSFVFSYSHSAKRATARKPFVNGASVSAFLSELFAEKQNKES